MINRRNLYKEILYSHTHNVSLKALRRLLGLETVSKKWYENKIRYAHVLDLFNFLPTDDVTFGLLQSMPLSPESNAQVDISNYDFLTRNGPSTRLWYEANSVISLCGSIKFYLHNHF
jgi:hypothetical protein